MPNWCSNVLRLSGEQPLIDRAIKAIENDRLCEEFHPIPEELKATTSPNRDVDTSAKLYEKYGYTDWYDFCVNEWGTKWDISGGDVSDSGKEYLVANFDTAWGPPINLMATLEQLGLDVTLDYYEPGMDFIGAYTTQGGDESWSVSDAPDDLRDFWGVEELEFDDDE